MHQQTSHQSPKLYQNTLWLHRTCLDCKERDLCHIILIIKLQSLLITLYSLETFIEICHKLLSRKYDKDHETIQTIVQYVWEHTRDIREAIAIAKIVDTPDEVNSMASTLRRYSNEMRAA